MTLKSTNGIMIIQVMVPSADFEQSLEYLKGKHRAKAIKICKKGE